MSLNAVKLLRISVTISPKKDILEYIQKYLRKRGQWTVDSGKNGEKSFIIVTPNPEQVVLAQKNTRFAEILNQADVAIPDGHGILLAAKFLNFQFPISNIQRIPGVEFMEDLVTLAAKEGYGIGLIGGRGGVAVKALECLRLRYPGLEGWAEEPGELSEDELGRFGSLGWIGKLGEKIKKTNTQIVFVGLGAPKQEYLMARLARELSTIHYPLSTIFMSVGGSLDIVAGRVKRAPMMLRALGLEWLWRLISEPWRWRRQIALVRFMLLVARERLHV